MTRECKADFIDLKKYIGNFNISESLEHAEYVESLKNMHKCYFSMIIWNAEIMHKKHDLLTQYKKCNEEIFSRISETASDMGASFFNWMNGSYKTSRVMLRVAIENFVRSVSAIDDKSQLTEKNVYSLFDKAEALAIFNSSATIKAAFNQLHADYVILCSDTHTTFVQNMEHLSSLAELPTFKKHKAEDTKNIYLRVAKNINCICCLAFNKFFHSMHHRNKENILYSLPKEVKPLVSNIV